MMLAAVAHVHRPWRHTLANKQHSPAYAKSRCFRNLIVHNAQERATAPWTGVSARAMATGTGGTLVTHAGQL